MTKTIASLTASLSTLRTGRASPSLLDRVVVSYYGADTPLNSLATISVSTPQQLQVTPFDPSSTELIEKAILEGDLGLVPNNSGDCIRINIPALTEERRKEMIKTGKGIGEDAKVRRSALEIAYFASIKLSVQSGLPAIQFNSIHSLHKLVLFCLVVML